jgi:predicted nucleic acid-binding Zn ribbon protein
MNENKRTSNQSTVGELIDKLMKAYRLDGKLKEIDVIESWGEMMGVAVANRTKNIEIRNKTLFLTMDSAVMRDELSYGKTVIIERVNQKAGFEMINDVFFG